MGARTTGVWTAEDALKLLAGGGRDDGWRAHCSGTA
jgi:hypothetical protein